MSYKGDKIKIIALFGKSACGKDTLLNGITSSYPEQFNKIIATTTRPRRENEIDGVHYYFINAEEFAKKVLDGTIIEATNFNNWFYGTEFFQLKRDKVNIGVFNPKGIECLLGDSRFDILPIYIDCFDKIRLQRSLAREKEPDCKEICRRFLADEKDFSYFDFDYCVFWNYENEENCNLLNLPRVKRFIKGE